YGLFVPQRLIPDLDFPFALIAAAGSQVFTVRAEGHAPDRPGESAEPAPCSNTAFTVCRRVGIALGVALGSNWAVWALSVSKGTWRRGKSAYWRTWCGQLSRELGSASRKSMRKVCTRRNKKPATHPQMGWQSIPAGVDGIYARPFSDRYSAPPAVARGA